MNLKTHIYILLISLALTYTLALTGAVTIFSFFVPFAFLLLLISASLLITDLVYTLSPLNIRQLNKNRKLRFRVIIILCSMYYLFVAWKINQYYLPWKFSFFSLSADVAILIFTIFLAYNLLIFNKNVSIITGLLASLLIFSTIPPMIYTRTKETSTSTLKALKSLPYLSYVIENERLQKRGVVTYNATRSYNGLNIYNSHLLPGAYLLDMSGNVLHKWLPKNSPAHWHYVELYDNGDLLVIVKDRQLMKLDINSQIKWILNIRSHHDVAVDKNNYTYVLTRREKLVFKFLIPLPILNDYIAILTPKGEIKQEISIYNVFKNKISFEHVKKIYKGLIAPEILRRSIKNLLKYGFLFDEGSPFDIFHSNTIELIDRDLNHVFKKGNILFCARDFNLIGIIDINEERLVWFWGADLLEFPHHPTLLKNGNILIFDNGSSKREFSRVIEINPSTEEIVWKYESRPPTSFYSSWGGANQRLPNGNTLITESDKGRVFEVTQDGKIVWEFYNPNTTDKGKRGTIYRMMRIPEPHNYSKLENF